jgi:hypothetical protein
LAWAKTGLDSVPVAADASERCGTGSKTAGSDSHGFLLQKQLCRIPSTHVDVLLIRPPTTWSPARTRE